MNTMTFKTPWVRSSGLAKGLALLALAAAGWAATTGTAQARDNVHFSIGLHAPGVAVGVSNGGPVYHQPYVIQHQPYPYPYVRPVVVAPAPVYYYPSRVYGPRWDDRRDRRHDRRDWRHDRHDRYNRRDRDDDRRGHGHR